MDNDLNNMSVEELTDEVKKLRAGIRAHRDSSGHNLCWFVPELWNLLPEKIEPKPDIPPKDEFLTCCEQYRNSLSKCVYCGGVSDNKTALCDYCLDKDLLSAE